MIGYDALHDGAAWLDISARGKLRLTGEDRARLLHAMSTNHIEQLTPGAGSYTFFLNAQGRILGDSNVLCRADSLLLDTEPETREKLYRHLDKYIIADDVTLADETAETATIALEGPKAEDTIERIGAPVPGCDYGSAEWGDRLVARISYTGAGGFALLAPVQERDAIARRLEAAGAVAADEEAFRTVRIEHARPRYGEDISERYLAQETNQMHAVHFHKGCYLGQEIVERVRSQARLHRRLLPLRIDAAQPPAAGAKLQSADGKDAADITSAAFSPRLGYVVALAYVRTDANPGDRLALGAVSATVLASAPVPTPESANCR
jgi:folate-binding protein YgfZ